MIEMKKEGLIYIAKEDTLNSEYFIIAIIPGKRYKIALFEL